MVEAYHNLGGIRTHDILWIIAALPTLSYKVYEVSHLFQLYTFTLSYTFQLNSPVMVGTYLFFKTEDAYKSA